MKRVFWGCNEWAPASSLGSAELAFSFTMITVSVRLISQQSVISFYSCLTFSLLYFFFAIYSEMQRPGLMLPAPRTNRRRLVEGNRPFIQQSTNLPDTVANNTVKIKKIAKPRSSFAASGDCRKDCDVRQKTARPAAKDCDYCNCCDRELRRIKNE